MISEIGLSGAKPARTPLNLNLKLTLLEHDKISGISGDEELADRESYQKLVGKLSILTLTMPDIYYGVQTLRQFMQQPKKSHTKQV